MKRKIAAVFAIAFVLCTIIGLLCACGNTTPKKETTTTVVYLISNRYYNTPYKYEEYTRTVGIKSQDDIVLAPNPQEQKPAGSYIPWVKSLGYTFVGWSLDEETIYDPSVKIEMPEYLRFYAIYTVNQYSVSYVLNGGTNDERNPVSYTVESGDRNSQVALYPASREGYEFAGWEDDYYDWHREREYIDTTPNMLHDCVLNATWTPIEYDIYYSYNSPSFTQPEGELQRTYTIESGAVLKPLACEGKVFVGWYDNAAFDGEPVTAIPVGVFGTKRFYAKWE